MLKFLTDLFKPQAAKAPPLTSDTSMNFDAEDVRPFLVGLMNNPRFGLPVELPDLIAETVSTLQVEDTKRLKVSGDFDDAPVDIEIEIFMDDIDAPDLYFCSSQPAIAEIERELTAFAEMMET